MAGTRNNPDVWSDRVKDVVGGRYGRVVGVVVSDNGTCDLGVGSKGPRSLLEVSPTLSRWES